MRGRKSRLFILWMIRSPQNRGSKHDLTSPINKQEYAMTTITSLTLTKSSIIIISPINSPLHKQPQNQPRGRTVGPHTRGRTVGPHTRGRTGGPHTRGCTVGPHHPKGNTSGPHHPRGRADGPHQPRGHIRILVAPSA